MKQGYFVGKVNRQLWDTVNKKFEEINFKNIDTNDDSHIADINYCEVIIHWQNKKKRIIKFRPVKNDSVMKVFLWLGNTYKYVILRQVKHSIKFETSNHSPPPIPSIKQVKFPPPTLEN